MYLLKKCLIFAERRMNSVSGNWPIVYILDREYAEYYYHTKMITY